MNYHLLTIVAIDLHVDYYPFGKTKSGVPLVIVLLTAEEFSKDNKLFSCK
jgi:hypothetical protein